MLQWGEKKPSPAHRGTVQPLGMIPQLNTAGAGGNGCHNEMHLRCGFNHGNWHGCKVPHYWSLWRHLLPPSLGDQSSGSVAEQCPWRWGISIQLKDALTGKMQWDVGLGRPCEVPVFCRCYTCCCCCWQAGVHSGSRSFLRCLLMLKGSCVKAVLILIRWSPWRGLTCDRTAENMDKLQSHPETASPEGLCDVAVRFVHEYSEK